MLDNISTEKGYLPNMIKFYRCNLENFLDFFQKGKTSIEDVGIVNTHLSTLYGRNLFELAKKKVLAIHLFFEFPVKKDVLTGNLAKYMYASLKRKWLRCIFETDTCDARQDESTVTTGAV